MPAGSILLLQERKPLMSTRCLSIFAYVLPFFSSSYSLQPKRDGKKEEISNTKLVGGSDFIYIYIAHLSRYPVRLVSSISPYHPPFFYPSGILILSTFSLTAILLCARWLRSRIDPPLFLFPWPVDWARIAGRRKMPFHLARLGADPRDERPRPTRNYKVRKPMANQYSGTPPKVISKLPAEFVNECLYTKVKEAI